MPEQTNEEVAVGTQGDAAVKLPDPEPKRKALDIEIYRKDGKTIFKFTIDPKIEALYKKQSGQIRTSESWKGLKFYYLPDMVEDENYENQLERLNLFDDYGCGLIRDGKMNIAWIRTVGGCGEFIVKNSVALADLSFLFKNATQFIKQHWENQFRDFKIKGSLTLEL